MNSIKPHDVAHVARRLEPLGARTVFTGGAIVPFLLDDPQFLDMRRTMDVDVIVEVVTRRDYSKVEERLRDLGFLHDTSEDAPKCRWLVDGVKVDVMPARDPTGEWRVRWFDLALETANTITVSDTTCLLITPPCFAATKLEAFADRGKGDYQASHDMEDVVAVVDGRASLADEIRESDAELRTYIADAIARHLESSAFLESLAGHLPPDAASQQRLPRLITKIRSLSAIRCGEQSK